MGGSDSYDDLIAVVGGLADLTTGEMTLGPVSVSSSDWMSHWVSSRSTTREDPPFVFEHAEGHEDWTLVFGPFALLSMGIPSLLDAFGGRNPEFYAEEWTDECAGQGFWPFGDERPARKPLGSQ